MSRAIIAFVAAPLIVPLILMIASPVFYLGATPADEEYVGLSNLFHTMAALAGVTVWIMVWLIARPDLPATDPDQQSRNVCSEAGTLLPYYPDIDILKRRTRVVGG